jgi:nucleotide-binding universal stress UspA family protein
VRGAALLGKLPAGAAESGRVLGGHVGPRVRDDLSLHSPFGSFTAVACDCARLGRQSLMKVILVGYDGSEEAERALGRAAEIAEAFSARLVVVSVGESSLVVSPIGLDPSFAGTVLAPVPVVATEPAEGELADRPKELAERELARAQKILAGRNIESEFLAETGDPRERLLELAEQKNADLIVVGSHERGLLDRLLERASVDQALARHSPRDVLLVH